MISERRFYSFRFRAELRDLDHPWATEVYSKALTNGLSSSDSGLMLHSFLFYKKHTVHVIELPATAAALSNDDLTKLDVPAKLQLARALFNTKTFTTHTEAKAAQRKKLESPQNDWDHAPPEQTAHSFFSAFAFWLEFPYPLNRSSKPDLEIMRGGPDTEAMFESFISTLDSLIRYSSEGCQIVLTEPKNKGKFDLVFISHPGETSDDQKARDFHQSFKGLNLFRVEQVTLYRRNDAIVPEENGLVIRLQCYAGMSGQLKACSVVDPLSYVPNVFQVIRRKAASHNLVFAATNPEKLRHLSQVDDKSLGALVPGLTSMVPTAPCTPIKGGSQKLAINQMIVEETKTHNRYFFAIEIDQATFKPLKLEESTLDTLKAVVTLLEESMKSVLNSWILYQDPFYYLVLLLNPRLPAVNRGYFKEEQRVGTKTLKAAGIQEWRTLKFTNLTDFLIAYPDAAPQFGDVRELNDWKDSVEDIDSADTTTKGLKDNFFKGMLSGKYNSLNNFVDSLVKDQDTELLSRYIDKKASFQELEKIALRLCKKEQALPKDTILTLQTYIERMKEGPGDKLDITDEELKSFQLLEAVDAIYKVFVKKEVLKLGCVLLYGAPNTGKTQLGYLLSEIFETHDKVKFSSFQPNADLRRNPQIIIMNEANTLQLFSLSHLASTKTLLAREGGVHEVKFMDPQYLFKGSACFISCNADPFTRLKEQGADLHDIAALEERILKVYMRRLDKFLFKFPLTANTLAMYLWRRHQRDLPPDTIATEYLIPKVDTEDQRGHETPILSMSCDFGLTQATTSPPSQITTSPPPKTPAKFVNGKRPRDLSSSLDLDLTVTEPPEEGTYDLAPFEELKTCDFEKQLRFDFDCLERKCSQIGVSSKYEILPQYEPLRDYYALHMPFYLIELLFKGTMTHREFSYELHDIKKGETRISRFNQYEDWRIMKKLVCGVTPVSRFCNGPVYKLLRRDTPKGTSLPFDKAELVFDIDLDKFTDRKCGCTGKTLCDGCWKDVIVPVVKAIDSALADYYFIKQRVWTFTGGRGVHCRCMDESLLQLGPADRRVIVEVICAMIRIHLKFPPSILDAPVTINAASQLLRLPFTVHESQSKIAVPFEVESAELFSVEKALKVEDLKTAAGLKQFNQIKFAFFKKLKAFEELRLQPQEPIEKIMEAFKNSHSIFQPQVAPLKFKDDMAMHEALDSKLTIDSEIMGGFERMMNTMDWVHTYHIRSHYRALFKRLMIQVEMMSEGDDYYEIEEHLKHSERWDLIRELQAQGHKAEIIKMMFEAAMQERYEPEHMASTIDKCFEINTTATADYMKCWRGLDLRVKARQTHFEKEAKRKALKRKAPEPKSSQSDDE